MRLGGFVIHADAAGVISPCLDSLASVCDELVTIDTGSVDGTRELATSKGFSVLQRPWEGYGAARAEAVKGLEGCDWVLFLDSDEWLGPEAIEAIRRLKQSPPDAPCVALSRRNWAELGGRRFVYQQEHPVRLVRREHARFQRRQIVHEVVPPGPTVRLEATIEHLYVTSIELLRSKVGRYALLWALRHQRERKPARSPTVSWLLHMARDLLLRRAAFTGRPEAVQIAAVMAEYHATKYALLRDLRAGRYHGLASLFQQDRLEELFRAIPADVDLELTSPWLSRLAGLPDRQL